MLTPQPPGANISTTSGDSDQAPVAPMPVTIVEPEEPLPVTVTNLGVLKVVVTNVDVPFGQLVNLIFKIMLAAIPAAVAAIVVLGLLAITVTVILGTLARR